ncbi:MAG: HAMP domain-containing protein [Rhodospirillaceae bacterium]|nr:MAG: HAMP domain-containing protein [Rhodospirillaceae bacterium]
MMVAIGLIGIFGGALVGYLLARFTISKPLSASLDTLRTLSIGDTTVRITGGERKNEIGEIAAAMETFKDNLIKNRKCRNVQPRRRPSAPSGPTRSRT